MPVASAATFAGLRKHFPGTAGGPYFDVSARGLFYDGGRAALDAHLNDSMNGTVDKAGLFKGIEQARQLFASLVRSHPDEIAFTRNVTDGIAAFAAAIDWKPGDNVVLCEELEHPANIYPWFGVARKVGIKVKNVPQVGGAVPIDRILGAIDASTRAVAVSTVSFAPGFCLPVAELGAECRRRGVLLLVDAAQSIGVVDTDVSKWQVDALAASTQKGLMSLYGLGFLYIRRQVAEGLKPAYLSRFGIEQTGHEASLGEPASGAYAAAARRFDVGNYNYAATIAVAPAIKLLLDTGPAAVQAYVFDLARDFANRMLDIGLPVYGGRPGPQSSHIVTVGANLGYDHDAAADLDMSSLYAHLAAGGVRLSIRRNLLRFSLHLYNNGDDIERVVALAKEWLSKRGKAYGQAVAAQ